MSLVPQLSASRLNNPSRHDLPLLVVGPSLGTSAAALWHRAAALLDDDFDVLGWDLPGHGSSAPTAAGFEIADLAAAVRDIAEGAQAARGVAGTPFSYAGDSVGGAVGLQLLLDSPDRVAAATILCSGAKIGEPSAWHERVETLRLSGIQAMVEAAPARWFGPGFAEREPATAAALLDALAATDEDSYALLCEALARFDVRSRLGEITTPVLAVAGADDVTTPPTSLRAVAEGVSDGELVVLDGVGHLAPAEAPDSVARLIRGHGASAATAAPHYPREGSQLSGQGPLLDAGMGVRRAVLGDAHVDRTLSAATDFSRDFQEFITRYAWGGVWTRPGLDRRTRSMLTLTALVAGGHHEELALHVRAARTNGLTNDEIKEVLIHSAVYVGVPAANSAFRIAQQVLDELDNSPSTTP
jgi:3-oxoadipate enol-lactonase/4-carboxymuconolactone decarboxylase